MRFYTLFLILILSLGVHLQAQVRNVSCKNQHTPKWYFTPYVALGSLDYNYGLNHTVYDADSVNHPIEQGQMISPAFGFHVVNIQESFRMGAGGELQGVYGKTSNGVSTNDQTLHNAKLYLRLEYRIYEGMTTDVGFYADGGAFKTFGSAGKDNNFGAFGKLGIFTNFVTEGNSSVLVGIDYQYNTFTNTIGSGLSHHVMKGLSLNVGYRIW